MVNRQVAPPKTVTLTGLKTLVHGILPLAANNGKLRLNVTTIIVGSEDNWASTDTSIDARQILQPAALQFVPIGHGLHTVQPTALQNVFTGHLLQFTMPTVAAYVPTGHNTLLGSNVPLAVNAL